MSRLLNRAELKAIPSLEDGRVDVVDLSGDVVLRLNLACEELTDHFDIIDRDENAEVEVGYFNVYLPIAASWYIPSQGKVSAFNKATPVEVVEVARHFIAGGIATDELRDITSLVLFSPYQVDVEVEVMVHPDTFEHPAEYSDYPVTIDTDPQELISNQLQEDPQPLIDFIAKYYSVGENSDISAQVLASTHSFVLAKLTLCN